jgi:hypothetical protein
MPAQVLRPVPSAPVLLPFIRTWHLQRHRHAGTPALKTPEPGHRNVSELVRCNRICRQVRRAPASDRVFLLYCSMAGSGR